MTEQEAMHIVRNPWGRSESVQREAALKLADLVESYSGWPYASAEDWKRFDPALGAPSSSETKR